MNRRDILKVGAALASPLAQAQSASHVGTAEVHFLTAGEGAAALTEGAEAAYFERMNLLEIRARLHGGADWPSLQAARQAARRFEASKVQSFSDDECAAIRDIVERLQPRLASRAPLYARTPWSFVKLGDDAEGGMPHTRGRHLVLPAKLVEVIARRARATNPLAPPRFGDLLVHEQTHVLQRLAPARFEPLFIDVLGFVRAPTPPTSPALARCLVQNPDAPDLSWVFPLDKLGGKGWIMPATVLPTDKAAPKMPQDFQAVAVELAREGGEWKVVDDAGQPRLRQLAQVPGYDAYFPYADEDIHPNEIAAVALSHWILQDDPQLAQRPRMEALAAWARGALA